MSLVLDEHREYLSDAARVGAFQRALGACVRPGDVVLDLASGTGILGLLACQAGAARVYAIESESIISVARQVARDNGFGERIIAIRELSTRASLPEPVDLIVTDLAGRFGFEAGLFEMLRDARRRFLKPGGRIIPASVTLWLCPVEARDVRAQVDFWSGSVAGLTFRAAQVIARSTGYPRHFRNEDLLAVPERLTGADLSDDVETLSGRVEYTLRRAGSLDGIGGWFSATLAPGIELTNAPGSPSRINRRNVFFPLRDAVAVQAGDRVAVSMYIRPENLVVRWRVDVSRDDKTLHLTDASTFEGMLVAEEDVERSRPGFRPALTEAGRARRTVLELCDGTHVLADIEREVFECYPRLFSRVSDAAAFVGEVLARYAG